jgi:hypothetical protein
MRFSTSGCLLLDANDVVVPAASEFIAGPGSNLGNTLVQCSATVENPTGRTIIYSGGGGVTCFGYGQETVRWREVITPSGRAELTCNIPD